ncbi:MAG: aldo/keto reductase [Rhodospirillaceae bacterium]
MKYAKLGNSGVVVSRIALGTMYFGEETPEADAFAILDAYVEAGGTFIDTADVYSGGASEEIVGRWLGARSRDLTSRIILATKGRAGDNSRPNDLGLSRRHLHRALDASLRRLGAEVIDLYQLHASDMQTPIEETLVFLDGAIRAGKIHYYGLSNFKGWELQLLVSTARSMGLPPPITLQPQYSLLSRMVEWEILPAARHNGLGILPWSPLAGGFLTGKYDRGAKPTSETRAGSKKGLFQWVSADYAKSDQSWATIDAVKQCAKKLGVPPSHIALSWLASRPGITAPVVGFRTLAHLAQNIGAADFVLDNASIALLDSVSAPVAGGYPYDAFSDWQRSRWLDAGALAPPPVFAVGSDRPLGG